MKLPNKIKVYFGKKEYIGDVPDEIAKKANVQQAIDLYAARLTEKITSITGVKGKEEEVKKLNEELVACGKESLVSGKSKKKSK